MYIYINDLEWKIEYINVLDNRLMRTDGSRTLGMTDMRTRCIYIAIGLNDKLNESVLCHEITHAFCLSYDFFMPIEEEEKLCNFMSIYGREIINVLDSVLHIYAY